MTKSLLIRLINNENTKLQDGLITQTRYDLWKATILNKMDTFLLCERISSADFEELNNMLL